MTTLHLVSADIALRSAVAEQLKLAVTEGSIYESETLPKEFIADPLAIILDASQAHDSELRALVANWKTGKKPKIFLIGEIKADLAEEIETSFSCETFVKPLRLGHLLSRVQFYFQTQRSQPGPLLMGPYRLEPSLRQLIVEETGATIRLTEKETQLLEYLGRTDRLIPREELLAAIWGYDGRIDTHTLETHIYRLRRKLDPDATNPSILIIKQGAYGLLSNPSAS